MTLYLVLMLMHIKANPHSLSLSFMLLVPQGDSSLLAVETKKNLSAADAKSNQKALLALNLLRKCATSSTSVSHVDTVHRHFQGEK